MDINLNFMFVCYVVRWIWILVVFYFGIGCNWDRGNVGVLFVFVLKGDYGKLIIEKGDY